MKNAYEVREKFRPDGTCIELERSIGPIVVWAIVALAAIFAGKALVSIPLTFWEFFKR